MTERVALEDRLTYARVGYTLLGGLWLSVIVMVVGFLLATGKGTGQIDHVTPLADVISGVVAGKPESILSLGILLLFATPFVGVLVALFEFIRRRDTPFIWIAGVLIIILIIGFAVALR